MANVSVRFFIRIDQINYLEELKNLNNISFSEHVRRALDLYFKEGLKHGKEN